MLSVAVHKDVAEYQPKIIGKLTARTLVSIVGAIGASLIVGLYCHFILGIPAGDAMYVIYAVSLPFWCIGFMRPKGMPFEQFVPLWIQHRFTNNRILYTSSIYRSGLSDAGADKKASAPDENLSRNWEKLKRTNGIEAWEPSATHR